MSHKTPPSFQLSPCSRLTASQATGDGWTLHPEQLLISICELRRADCSKWQWLEEKARVFRKTVFSERKKKIHFFFLIGAEYQRF